MPVTTSIEIDTHVAALGYLSANQRTMLHFLTYIPAAISIETGMQSAALGYLLAKKHFPSDPLTAVPSAVGVFAMAR